MPLELSWGPAELQPAQYLDGIRSRRPEPLDPDAVQPEERGDATFGSGQVVTGRESAGQRIFEPVVHRYPVRPKLPRRRETLPAGRPRIRRRFHHFERHGLDATARQLVGDSELRSWCLPRALLRRQAIGLVRS